MKTQVVHSENTSNRSKHLRILSRLLLYPILAYVWMLVLLLIFETSLVYPAPKFPNGNWNPTNLAFEEIANGYGEITFEHSLLFDRLC